MSRCPLHDVAIVGAYNTRQARRLSDTTEPEILMEAVKRGGDRQDLHEHHGHYHHDQQSSDHHGQHEQLDQQLMQNKVRN